MSGSRSITRIFANKPVPENFVSLLEASARRFPRKNALVWDGGYLSYRELDLRASGFAHFLTEQKIRPGDRVAVLISNKWAFVVALLGGLKLGATMVPLSTLLKTEERAEVLANLRPRLIVNEVGVEERPWNSSPTVNFPAVILYSSGSTGQPKGAVISHDALTFASRSWVGMMALVSEDIVLAVLPLPHAFGIHGALFAPLLVGATVIFIERFSPEQALDAISKHRVTVFPGVATMFRRLLSSPAFATADFSSLRLAVSGAAPCPWELAQEWRSRTGTRMLRGYGMTELFRPISYLAGDPADRPEAVGRAVPGVEVCVVDETGQPLPHSKVGELWIRTPSVMDGYLSDPEETRAVLENGWFKTGDMATVSQEGFIQIVGRKRERILRGGYSVFPQEVEAVLLSHPAVAEAAVVASPDPDLGEEVAAFVVLKQGAKATGEEIISYCQERLAAFKYPRHVTLLERLPRGATGKVLKSELMKERH